MLAESPSRFKNFIWPHEDDPKERLLLDPIPQEEMNQIMLKPMLKKPSAGYWLLVGAPGSHRVGLCLRLVVLQMRWGMGTDGIRRPIGWGLLIVTFVFWIGISHSGTFVSAILRSSTPSSAGRSRARPADHQLLLICGGLYPIIDLGRAWVVYWMLPIPNERGLWDNFQSPLAWDLLAITTYLLGSTIYVFLPMIPDLAMTRDHTTGWRHVLYKLASLGWRGLEYEWHYLHKAINIFAFAIIPIMFSVHTIVSWDSRCRSRPDGTTASSVRTSWSAPSCPACRP